MTVAADGVASSPDANGVKGRAIDQDLCGGIPRDKGSAAQGIGTGRHKPASVDGPFSDTPSETKQDPAPESDPPFPFLGCALVRKTPQPRALANRQNGQDRACDTFGS